MIVTFKDITGNGIEVSTLDFTTMDELKQILSNKIREMTGKYFPPNDFMIIYNGGCVDDYQELRSLLRYAKLKFVVNGSDYHDFKQ